MAENENAGEPKVSVVIPSKGRLHHLRKTLPTVLGQACPFPFEVIVVDYGCPNGTHDWCKQLDHRTLIAVKVLDDTSEFILSRARNCGAVHARSPILAFVDADMQLWRDWLALAAAPVLSGQAGLCTVATHNTSLGWDRSGTCVVAASVFHAVRGYDEAMLGWGVEDDDFYNRCAAIVPRSAFSAGLLFPIRHSDAERVKHNSEKSRSASCDRNQQVLRERVGLPNPLGYGRGDFAIHRGAKETPLAVCWPGNRHIRRPVRQPA